MVMMIAMTPSEKGLDAADAGAGFGVVAHFCSNAALIVSSTSSEISGM